MTHTQMVEFPIRAIMGYYSSAIGLCCSPSSHGWPFPQSHRGRPFPVLLSFRSRATSWVTPTPVMSSLICWCRVFLGRPRRLVHGIARSITLRVTLFSSLFFWHVQTNEDGHCALPRRSVKGVICVEFLSFVCGLASTLRASREASSSPW